MNDEPLSFSFIQAHFNTEMGGWEFSHLFQ